MFASKIIKTNLACDSGKSNNVREIDTLKIGYNLFDGSRKTPHWTTPTRTTPTRMTPHHTRTTP